MAWYKYDQYLTKSDSGDFDKEHTPGTEAPFSGIYRCMGCGSEVASNQKEPLPSQNHSQHSTSQGSIRWKLVVYADHKQK
jgi:hypothetical protein